MDPQTRSAFVELKTGALEDRINDSMKVITDGVRIGIIDGDDLLGRFTQLMKEQRRDNEEEAGDGTIDQCVFPRHCQVCTVSNATVRFGLIGCDHFCCTACFKQLTGNSKRITCPYCPKVGKFVKTRENIQEEKKADSIIEDVKNKTKKKSTIRRLVRCILPYL